LNSRGKHNIRLEFSDFELEPGVSNFPFDKYWIELRNLPIASSVGASNEFQTKIGLEKAHKSNLIAVAMTLQGCTQGDTMHIQFSTNDALNDLEDGRIDLRRLVKHCAHSPLSLAFPTNETK
jgi:hypothetical protein